MDRVRSGLGKGDNEIKKESNMVRNGPDGSKREP